MHQICRLDFCKVEYISCNTYLFQNQLNRKCFLFFLFSFFFLLWKKIHICKVFWNIYQGVPWNKINHELNHIHIWLFLKIPTQFKIMIATPSILPEHAKNCTKFCPGKILLEFSLLIQHKKFYTNSLLPGLWKSWVNVVVLLRIWELFWGLEISIYHQIITIFLDRLSL